MAAPLEFTGDIRGGVIVPPSNMGAFFRHCEGKQARIIVSWGLKKRTLKQNSYYKGIVVPQFGAFLREQGCDISNEQADLLLKKWVYFERQQQLPDGSSETVCRSTTECDTKEMSEFTEAAIAEIAKRFNFYIPLPDKEAA